MSEKTIRPVIALCIAAGPPRYRKLAQWLVENYYRVPFLSASVAKKETGTHPYDLVQFARMLGFDGWDHLKESLLKELTRDMVEFYGDAKKSEIAATIYRNVAHKGREDERGCRNCDYEMVFRIRKRWYFDARNGLPEPKIRFCPRCGHELRRRPQ